MRVIAGKYKNRLIKSSISKKKIEGLRPTTSLVRESVFNIINSYLDAQDQDIACCSFLDLCCGSGIVGIEALSRGFQEACFVDANKDSMQLVFENTSFIDGKYCNYSLSHVEKLNFPAEKTFDVIFLDPPYKNSQILDMILHIRKFMHKKTLIILELRKNYKFSLPIEFQKCFYKKYSNCQIIGLEIV